MQRAVYCSAQAMCDFMKMIQNALPKFRAGHGFRDCCASATEENYDDLEYNAAFTHIAVEEEVRRVSANESETTEEELKRSVKLGLEKCNLLYGIEWIFPADSDHVEPRTKRPKMEVSMVPKEAANEAFDYDQGDPGAVTTDRGRRNPEAEEGDEGDDKGSGDPGEGRVEGGTETREGRGLQALGLGEAEGGVEVRREKEDSGDEVPEDDDAQGQDEGFKEDDQGSREGARKGGLTREWLDMMFYDTEEDGDEGFDEDECEERQPGVDLG